MQRILDLIGIANGVSKVGQAFVQGTSNQIQHGLRTSSVVQPIGEKLRELCNCDGSDSLNAEETEYEFNSAENDDDVTSVETPVSSSFPSENNNSTSSENAPNSPQSRAFSTFSRFSALENRKTSPFAERVDFYRTSSVNCALTANDLAKLAKLKQMRKKETGNGEKIVKKQTLNSQSREKKVPSSRISRISSFGSLAAGMALNSLTDYVKKGVGFSKGSDGKASNETGTLLLSESNLNRIVSTLCTVRGAALKLGQMLSIQDSSIVDPKLLEVFDRVRQSADFMPASQMKRVLVQEFGDDWRSKVKEFDEKPFAAASIGQVHRAVLFDGREVAMKIQYPGVAKSINSDINNLVTLMKIWKIFPEQLFIDRFIDVARAELALECDYVREAEFSEKFRVELKGDEIYGVPKVVPELSGKRVLTSELVTGVPVDQVVNLSQDHRNYVAAAVLRLVLRELFEFRCMQTDPNWSNFLYDEEQQKLWLLDFGASRYYSQRFVDQYIEVVKGASVGDRAKVLDISKSLGFLTGYEPKVMEEAHVDAIMILGEPFSVDQVFDFGKQSTSNRIVKLIPTFLKHRLTPPPEESYSLHRKLSGAFLIATKLRAEFACKEMFDNVYRNYWAAGKSES